MKRHLFCLMICLTVFGTVLSLHAEAAQGGVVFDGDADSFVVLSENKDLFTNLKGVYPGDSVRQTIDLHNDSDDEIAIYLKARAVQNQYQPLLKKMSLAVYDTQGRCVSYSAAAEQGGIRENVLIAKLNPHEKQKMALDLVVDRTMGNEFQSSKGVIEWVFTAEKDAEPYSGKVEGASTDENPTKPPRGVLGAFSEWLPQTGDTGSAVVGIVGCISVLSAVIVGMVIRLRKLQ